LAVYITEAHARDEWPVGASTSICNQPKTLSERLAIANRFVAEQDFKLPMVVDTMSNAFMQQFSAWPVRFYIISDGKVALKAQPNDETYRYSLRDISQWFADRQQL